MEEYLKNISFITSIVIIFLLLQICEAESSSEKPANSYLKREFSLAKPYSGNGGMSMLYWDFRDNAMITNNFIRLTQDTQGQRGGIWGKIPCHLRDWEAHIQFKVHGSGRSLAADGMAFWYTQGRMTPGPVFGSRDNFQGLGVFLDTYKNGNKAVTFPQVSAMVGNGTVEYDHLEDGRGTSIGSCSSSFRNKKHDTYMAVRYTKETLTIKFDVSDQGVWKDCVSLTGVRLPTGYFFGFSAATGDLADNHEVISFKLYELEVPRTPEEEKEDWSTVLPGVSFFKPPIDNVDDMGTGGFRNTAVGGIKLLLLTICALFGLGIVAVVGYVIFRKRQEENRKRFY